MKGPEKAFSQEVALETDGLGETAPLQGLGFLGFMV